MESLAPLEKICFTSLVKDLMATFRQHSAWIALSLLVLLWLCVCYTSSQFEFMAQSSLLTQLDELSNQARQVAGIQGGVVMVLEFI